MSRTYEETSSFGTILCTFTASEIILPIVILGGRLEYGSWKISCIEVLNARIFFLEISVISSPL